MLRKPVQNGQKLTSFNERFFFGLAKAQRMKLDRR